MLASRPTKILVVDGTATLGTIDQFGSACAYVDEERLPGKPFALGLGFGEWR